MNSAHQIPIEEYIEVKYVYFGIHFLETYWIDVPIPCQNLFFTNIYIYIVRCSPLFTICNFLLTIQPPQPPLLLIVCFVLLKPDLCTPVTVYWESWKRMFNPIVGSPLQCTVLNPRFISAFIKDSSCSAANQSFVLPSLFVR